MSETQISAVETRKNHRRKYFEGTDFTSDFVMHLCVQMAEGVGLGQVCAQEGIDKWTAYNALLTQPHAQTYAMSRELLAHKFAVEIITIADDESIDPNSRRVRCDARKWAAAKLLPKVYSDKHIIAGDPDNPIEHRISVMTAEERRAEIGKLTNDLLKLAGPIIDAKAEPGEES